MRVGVAAVRVEVAAAGVCAPSRHILAHYKN